eukprot:gene8538-biopygen7629
MAAAGGSKRSLWRLHPWGGAARHGAVQRSAALCCPALASGGKPHNPSKFGLRGEGGGAMSGGVHADYCFLAAGKGVSMLTTTCWDPERTLRARGHFVMVLRRRQGDFFLLRRKKPGAKPAMSGDVHAD